MVGARVRVIFAVSFLAGSAGLAAAAPAYGSGPAYVGTWGVDTAQCGKPQEIAEAPMAIGAKGYDQYETHCVFSGVKRKGSTWKMKATCSVEGDKQVQPLSLTVKGDKLTYRWGTGAPQSLIRCK